MGHAAEPSLDAARDRGARVRSVRLRGICRNLRWRWKAIRVCASGRIGYSS